MGHLAILLYKRHQYAYKVEEVLNERNIEHYSEINVDSSICFLPLEPKQTEDPEGSTGLYQVTLERMGPIAVSIYGNLAVTYQAELSNSLLSHHLPGDQANTAQGKLLPKFR